MKIKHEVMTSSDKCKSKKCSFQVEKEATSASLTPPIHV